MRLAVWAFFALHFHLLTTLANEAVEKASSVSIPLNEYLNMKQQLEGTHLTALEEARLSGNFPKDLSLTIKGRVKGKAETIVFLTRSPFFSLSNCRGQALVTQGGANYELLALAPTFELICAIKIKEASEAAFSIQNVLSVTSQVSGVESRIDSTETSTTVVLTRAMKVVDKGRQDLPLLGVGNYHVSIYPNEIRFRYFMNFENPNRGLKSFVVPLKNSETVQSVRTNLEYDEGDNEITFKVSPGSSSVELVGRLPEPKFLPLLSSEQQYLLIESHPTLKLELTGGQRRVSLNEVPMGAAFTNARAFMISKDEVFSWTIKKLEVYSSSGYTVSSAYYRAYLPESGHPIVEANFIIENQGTPEIPLDVPGKITYLEVGSQAQVLYKGGDGKLLVPLRVGRNDVLVQYQPDKALGGLASRFRHSFVKPAAVMTNVHVNLLTPSKWNLLFGSSFLDGASDWSLTQALFAFLLSLGVFYLMKSSGLERNKILGIAILGFGAMTFSTEFGWTVGLALVVVTLIRYRGLFIEAFKKKPIVTAVAAVVVAGFLLATLSMVISFATKRTVSSMAKMSSYDTQGESAQRAPAHESMQEMDSRPRHMAKSMPGAPAIEEGTLRHNGASQETEDFEGIPAKIQIPTSVRYNSFTQSSVDAQRSVSLKAFVMSKPFLEIFSSLLFAAMLLWLVLERRRFLGWMRLI